MIADFLHEIEEHFREEYPREGCGVICVKKGKMLWVPCKNIAEEGQDFLMDSQEYIKLKRTSDIVGIVHSHPDADNTASDADITYCNALGIPYYIFSYPDMELNVLQPTVNTTELFGREYKFTESDCFEASRDYLRSVGINIAPRVPFEDDWWEKDIDYFTDEMMKEWGFEPVDIKDIQKHDVLTFNIRSSVANHCGIYLGGETFYHHAENRLSCRESLHPFWAKNIKRVYRYVT